MPALTIYRHERAILSRQDAVHRFAEYAFAPLPEIASVSELTGLRLWRSAARPIAVRVPPGAEVVAITTADGREIVRLRKTAKCLGIDAEAVHWLAERREDGFRLEDPDMARRRQDAGPSLFDGAADIPGTPPDIPSGGPVIPGPGPNIPWQPDARIDRLEAAIREALPWLHDEGGRQPMPLTAANILAAALEG